MDSSNSPYEPSFKSKDPNAPTAIFLDDFLYTRVELAPGVNITHGDLSELGARQSGYTTFRFQYSDPEARAKGYSDFSKTLNEIDDDIHSGKLKGIGKGDVLNVSLGNPASTYEQLSQYLGFQVTADNIAQKKDDIFKRVGEIATDPQRTPEERARAQAIVDTNRAIDRLQADGVTVINAAGNVFTGDGKNYYSLDFMNAKVQLSSNKPDGTPDGFSVANSLTTKGNGVLPVIYHSEPDLLDPRSIAEQQGNIEIVGTGLSFPKTDILLGNKQILDRNHFVKSPLPTAKPDPRPITSEDLLPKLTVPEATAQLTPGPVGHVREAQKPKFTERVGAPAPPPPVEPFVSEIKPGQTMVGKVIVGTSFSNIEYLHDQYRQLRQEKADATFLKIWNPNDFPPKERRGSGK